MTVGEELILGLQTLVLGMVVTFIGLAILQVIMILMGRASDRKRAPAGYAVGGTGLKPRYATKSQRQTMRS